MGTSRVYATFFYLALPSITRNQSNVLVDRSGRACIADFGLTKITKHPHSVQSASQRYGLALQWSAPEVLKEGEYSKKADVFSFGMVVYEVCC